MGGTIADVYTGTWVRANVEFSGGGPRVVWLLDTPDLGYDHGLGGFKTDVRITVEVPNSRVSRWLDWAPAKAMADWWRSALLDAAGGAQAAEHWWISEAPIPRQDWIRVEARLGPRGDWLELDPDTGSPYWLKRAADLDFEPRDITKYAELSAFGPFPLPTLRPTPQPASTPRPIARRRNWTSNWNWQSGSAPAMRSASQCLWNRPRATWRATAC